MCCVKACHWGLLFLDHKHNDTTNRHYHPSFCDLMASPQ
ncbi:hypothetical protein SynNOUM97013_01333 [Synechococcus sp. NOUM97013]|nr:hypothetical protein SynNOUM97013_01333 [Synechococcus sp. NOUM97013]